MKMPSKRSPLVREPVQVYLSRQDRDLLERIAGKTGWSRAEVLRRGMRRVAADVLADESPMLAFLRESASAEWPSDTPSDVAERHDAYVTNPKRSKKRRTR